MLRKAQIKEVLIITILFISSTIIKCPHCNGESIIKSGITYHKQKIQ